MYFIFIKHFSKYLKTELLNTAENSHEAKTDQIPLTYKM